MTPFLIIWHRLTRFKDTTIFQDIFNEIILQAINRNNLAIQNRLCVEKDF
jgi:hypothetical protein